MQTTEPVSDLELLTIEDVSRLMQLSQRGIRNLFMSGRFPRPRKIGRATRWHAATVRAWMNETFGEAR